MPATLHTVKVFDKFFCSKKQQHTCTTILAVQIAPSRPYPVKSKVRGSSPSISPIFDLVVQSRGELCANLRGRSGSMPSVRKRSMKLRTGKTAVIIGAQWDG
jgi:hypothetical protein